MERVIEETLHAARRASPERLRQGFSDEVMQRIALASREYRVPMLIATRSGFAMTAAVAVIAALVTSRSEGGRSGSEVPPPSLAFQTPRVGIVISE